MSGLAWASSATLWSRPSLCSPVQTPCRPLGAPPRTPQRPRLVGLQIDLLATPHEGPSMILLRARSFASVDFICATVASCQVRVEVPNWHVYRPHPLQHPLCGRAGIDLVGRSPRL